jgi:hypothetical protein
MRPLILASRALDTSVKLLQRTQFLNRWHTSEVDVHLDTKRIPVVQSNGTMDRVLVQLEEEVQSPYLLLLLGRSSLARRGVFLPHSICVVLLLFLSHDKKTNRIVITFFRCTLIFKLRGAFFGDFKNGFKNNSSYSLRRVPNPIMNYVVRRSLSRSSCSVFPGLLKNSWSRRRTSTFLERTPVRLSRSTLRMISISIMWTGGTE